MKVCNYKEKLSQLWVVSSVGHLLVIFFQVIEYVRPDISMPCFMNAGFISLMWLTCF